MSYVEGQGDGKPIVRKYVVRMWTWFKWIYSIRDLLV